MSETVRSPSACYDDAAQGSEPNLRRRAAIQAQTKRAVFRRDRVCQWVHAESGQICGGTFQLQVDHVKPVHLGGGNDLENLQILCGVHNRGKSSVQMSARLVSLSYSRGLSHGD